MWRVASIDARLCDRISAELALHPVVARILVGRKIALTPEGARDFLAPKLSSLDGPAAMANLSRAVERMSAALRQHEKIAVFGDYDVDGVTSSALIAGYLRQCGGDVIVRMARRDEGYGFSVTAARELLGQGAKLIVLTDCGTSDHQAVAEVCQSGVDVICIDHHRVVQGDWPGLALINPHHSDCGFRFKGLCSAGLAFYVVAALRSTGGSGINWPDPRESLDLVALGTLADVAPLVAENRTLVKKGLEQLCRTQRPGLRELIRLWDIGSRTIQPDDVSWRIGPRLNAPGRIGDAVYALNCLLADDAATAIASARRCDELNNRRKTLQTKTVDEAMAQAREQAHSAFVMVAGEGWHPGVIGIVASRLAEEMGRPSAVIAWDGEMGRGSVRSIPGVDLITVFGRGAEHLVRYGGHAQALGFSVERQKFDALKSAINAATLPVLDRLPEAEVNVDVVIRLAEVENTLCDDLARLEPHGNEHPRPLLGVAGVELVEAKVVGDKHWAVTFNSGGVSRRGIGFGLASQKKVRVGDRCDVAFFLDRDTFRGANDVRMRLREIVPAGAGFSA